MLYPDPGRNQKQRYFPLPFLRVESRHDDPILLADPLPHPVRLAAVNLSQQARGVPYHIPIGHAEIALMIERLDRCDPYKVWRVGNKALKTLEGRKVLYGYITKSAKYSGTDASPNLAIVCC